MKNFTKTEKRLIGGISLLLGIRMLGVSLVLPIFSIFANSIYGSSEVLAGVAVGIFGVAQIIFQIPMGHLSDRWGRKQTTMLALAIFALGTFLSGLSQNIYHLIASRFLAGTGAVAGVSVAWLTDGIARDRRTHALSYTGMSFGISVILGFSLSAFVAASLGIPHLFYFCALLTVVSILFTGTVLKNGDIGTGEPSVHVTDFKSVIKDRNFLRLCVTGMIANMALTGTFFIMPILIKKQIAIIHMWKVLIPMGIIGTAMMFIFARRADRQGSRGILMFAFALEIAGLLLPIVSGSLTFLFIAFVLVYSGHCVLSPVLPAAVSHYPGDNMKGVIMSAFYSSQFLGGALGGILSGVLLKFAPSYIFVMLIAVILIAIWQISGFKDYREAV